MPVNWILEAIKWKFIISKEEKINISTAFRAVLGGITVSMITPNRTGEFLGRVFVLKSPVKGILLTLTGSFSQLITTFIFGCISLFIALPVVLNYFSVQAGNYLIIMQLTLIILVAGSLLVFFNFPRFYKLFESPLFLRFEKLRKYAQLSTAFNRKDLSIILSVSIIRYVVFSTQYYLLLKLCGITLPLQIAYLIISIQYFIMAFIPSVALSEIGIRGSVAIMLFTIYFNYNNGVVIDDRIAFAVAFASVSLWIINLAIPTMAGIPAVFKTRFLKYKL